MSVEPTRIGQAAGQPTGLKLAVYRGSVGVSVRYKLVNDSGTRGLPLHAYVCSIQPSGHGQRTRRAGGSNHGCSALPVAFCSGELQQPLIHLEPRCYWHMAQLWSIAWRNCHCHELRSSAVSPNRENLVDMPEPPRLWSSINAIQPSFAALPADRPSYRGLTTGRLGNSNADSARGRKAIRSALFAFTTALRVPKLLSSPVSAANKRRVPVFTDEETRPCAPSVFASLLADRALDPRARAPTRAHGLALSFIPWIRLEDLETPHAGVVSAPRNAA